MASPRRFTSMSNSRQLWALSRTSHLETDEFLPALRCRADQDEHAFRVLLHSGLEVDAVGPHIDVAPGREVAPLPSHILGLPLGRETCNLPLSEYLRQRTG